jgi:hypothetical protein
MAKKSKRNHHHKKSTYSMPTLTKNVPHAIAYVTLAALFLLAVIIVREVTGVGKF